MAMAPAPVVVNRNRLIFGNTSNVYVTNGVVALLNKDELVDLYVVTIFERDDYVDLADEDSMRDGQAPYDMISLCYPVESALTTKKWTKFLSHNNFFAPTLRLGHSEVERVKTLSGGLKDSSESTGWIVVADSDRYIYLFWRNSGAWSLYTAFQTKLRIKLLTLDIQHCMVILTDKCGDVYVSDYGERQKASQFKRILGHCGLILDTVVAGMSSDIILTADKDMKIRCSEFPRGHVIQQYFLGHTGPVISIGVFNNRGSLISVSENGLVKTWCLTRRECTSTWTMHPENLPPGALITGMKVYEQKGPLGVLKCAFNLSGGIVLIYELNKGLDVFTFVGSTCVGDIFWIQGIPYGLETTVGAPLPPADVEDTNDEVKPANYASVRVVCVNESLSPPV